MPGIYPPHPIQVSKANANTLPAEKLSAQLQRQIFSTIVTSHFAVHVLYVLFWDFKTSMFNGGTMNKYTSKDHEEESPSSKHKTSFQVYLNTGGTYLSSKGSGDYFARCYTDTLSLYFLWMKKPCLKKARAAVKLNTGLFESYVTSLEVKNCNYPQKCVAYINDEIKKRVEGFFFFFFPKLLTPWLTQVLFGYFHWNIRV